HTFGLGHAGTASCADGCDVMEPGDPYSPMGTGDRLLDFSAYEKVVLGWLPAQAKVTGNGRYLLAPASRDGPGRHALVIDTNHGEWWIEYRAKPFRGLLVRFVDVLHPTPTFALGPILMLNPTHHHRNWIARGTSTNTSTRTCTAACTASRSGPQQDTRERDREPPRSSTRRRRARWSSPEAQPKG